MSLSRKRIAFIFRLALALLLPQLVIGNGGPDPSGESASTLDIHPDSTRSSGAPIEDPTDRDQWLATIQKAIREGDGEKLKKATMAFHEEYPNDSEVALYCGTIWLQTGNWEYIDLLDVDPPAAKENPRANLNEAMQAARSKELYRAYQYLQLAYEMDSGNRLVLLNYGTFLCRFGNCSKGRELIDKLVEIAPDDPYSHLAKAKAALAFQDVETGWAALDEAERLLEEKGMMNPRMDQELEKLMLQFLEIKEAAENEPEDG